MITLSDRIKEISYVIGTGNIALSGSVNGFSTFSSAYSNNAKLFYAITDGKFYEIGSGIYSSTNNDIQRFPIKSTSNNDRVSFTAGLKEVYVTYPASHAVYNTSGINSTPKDSGIAFWTSANSLSYSDKIVFDSGKGSLGINKSNPLFPLDVNGVIRSSGFFANHSGIIFPSGLGSLVSYSGGTQLTHFEMNNLDEYCFQKGLIGNLTGSDELIELSGDVNQYILLKKQSAGTVFAGPTGDCIPPCNPSYPAFRPLVATDIPALPYSPISHNHISSHITDFAYSVNNVNDQPSSVVRSVSGIVAIVSGDLVTASGALNSRITDVSGLLVSTSTSLTNSILGTANSLTNQINAVSGIINASGALLTSLIQSSNTHTATLSSDGRLSLDSSSSTAEGVGSTLYFVPHNGTSIFLYNGSSWVSKTFSSSQVVLAAMLDANKNYDIFANIAFDGSINYSYLAWTNNTTRATNIVLKDGVYCMAGGLSHRYLGTVRRQSEFALFANLPSERLISNADNRILIFDQTNDNPGESNTWSCSSQAFLSVPVFPSIKIVYGLKDVINLSASLIFTSISQRSSYVLAIDSDGISRRTQDLSTINQNMKFNDRFIDVDVNDNINIDLNASAEIYFDGYDNFYPIERSVLSNEIYLVYNDVFLSQGFKYTIKY